jgi:glycosyltransferase involved in cell wall biosynthesis
MIYWVLKMASTKNSIAKVIWLGFAVPDKIAFKYFEYDGNPAIQTHRFGWSLIYAFKAIAPTVDIISAVPLQNFPLCKKVLIKGGRINFDGSVLVMLNYINIIILKHITRFFNASMAVVSSIFRKNADWIVIHGVHTPYLLIGYLLRMCGFKVAVVLTDLPGIHLVTDGYFAKKLKALDYHLAAAFLNRMSAILTVSKKLAERMSSKTPVFLFPGIVDPKFIDLISSAKNNNECKPALEFTVIYAGGLSSSYGVDLLVQAMRYIPKDLNVRLKIYGMGELSEYLKQKSGLDERVFFGGFVPSEEMARIYMQADLLINPRPVLGEVSEMSFPSKLIEYTIAKRNVLTSRILSMPDDIKDCFYYIEEVSADGIARAIMDVIKINADERASFSEKACKKIMDKYSVRALSYSINNFLCSK